MTAQGAAPRVRQTAYLVTRAHKPAALGRILDIEAPTAAIVFCRTRDEVDRLTETLNGRGYRAEALHGGMDQNQRDRVMGRLRAGTSELLVATDVAARGLDIDSLTHVVNYDVPSAVEPYVHRIGRVGRGGREGVAITLAEPREHRQLKAIERATKQRIAIEKIPTTADLQARRLELTRAALHEILLAGRARVVPRGGRDADRRVRRDAGGAGRGEARARVVDRPRRRGRGRHPRGRVRPSSARLRAVGSRRRARVLPRGARAVRPPSTPRGCGSAPGASAGIRPQDLVGAIAGESRLSGRDIGAIEITDKFSLVDIPADAADEVIDALSKTRIKGQQGEGAPRPRRRLPLGPGREELDGARVIVARAARSSRRRGTISACVTSLSRRMTSSIERRRPGSGVDRAWCARYDGTDAQQFPAADRLIREHVATRKRLLRRATRARLRDDRRAAARPLRPTYRRSACCQAGRPGCPAM